MSQVFADISEPAVDLIHVVTNERIHSAVERSLVTPVVVDESQIVSCWEQLATLDTPRQGVLVELSANSTDQSLDRAKAVHRQQVLVVTAGTYLSVVSQGHLTGDLFVFLLCCPVANGQLNQQGFVVEIHSYRSSV